MRTVQFGLAVILLLLSSGCATVERTTNQRLATVMRENGYTLYTPMRTKDYPGSMFVLSKGADGRITEFTVARYNQAFDAADSVLSAPQNVGFADTLTENFQFSAAVGAEIGSAIVKPELAAKYARSISITFRNPKLEHKLSLADLSTLRGQLTDPTRQALTYLKETGQLNRVYLVMQTVTVSGLDVELTLKPEFMGTLSADKIKDIANVNATVSSSSDGKVTIRSEQPLVIGYKAVRFPDSMLGTQVSSAPPQLEYVTAETMGELKK